MPKTPETALLSLYREVAGDGVLFTESQIPLPGGRRLDAVRFPNLARPVPFATASESEGAQTVEVIEVKSGLSEEVVGQVLVGVEMLREAYPTIGTMEPVVVCEVASPDMLEVASSLGIRLWSPKAAHLQTPAHAYMRSRTPSMWKRDLWVPAVETLRARQESLFITDVPLGGSTINLVRVCGGPDLLAKFETEKRFHALIDDRPVELIEVRRKARRGVAGRLLSHRVLLEKHYGVAASKLRVIALEADAELGKALRTLGIEFGLPDEHGRSLGRSFD